MEGTSMVVRLLTSRDCGEKSAIKYNFEKVIDGTASVIGTHLDVKGTVDNKEEDYSLYYDPIEAEIASHGIEIPVAKPTMFDVLERLREYEHANLRTVRPWFHMAVNPGPEDHMSEEQVISFVDDLMASLGLENQPYIIFEHKDIERRHYHTVSISVDRNGHKVHPMRPDRDGVLKPYKLDERSCHRAMLDLQQEYGYKIGIEKPLEQTPERFDAKLGHISQQVRNIITEELENPHVNSLLSLEQSAGIRGVSVSYKPSPRGGYFVCKGLEQNGEPANVHSVSLSSKESKEIYNQLYEVNKKQRVFGLVSVTHALEQSQSLAEARQRINIETPEESVTINTEVYGGRYNYKPDDLLNGLGSLLNSKTEKDFEIRKKMLINRSTNLSNTTNPFAEHLPEDYKTLKAQDICEKMNSSKAFHFPDVKTPVQIVSLKIEHSPEKEEEWKGPGRMTIKIEDAERQTRTFEVDQKGRILMEQMPGYNRLYDVNKGVAVTENIPAMENSYGHIRRGR